MKAWSVIGLLFAAAQPQLKQHRTNRGPDMIALSRQPTSAGQFI